MFAGVTDDSIVRSPFEKVDDKQYEKRRRIPERARTVYVAISLHATTCSVQRLFSLCLDEKYQVKKKLMGTRLKNGQGCELLQDV